MPLSFICLSFSYLIFVVMILGAIISVRASGRRLSSTITTENLELLDRDTDPTAGYSIRSPYAGRMGVARESRYVAIRRCMALSTTAHPLYHSPVSLT